MAQKTQSRDNELLDPSGIDRRTLLSKGGKVILLGGAALAGGALLNPPPVRGGSVFGSGASPFLAKWTATDTLGSSIFQDDGTSLKPTSDNVSDLATSTLRLRTLYSLGLDGGASNQILLKGTTNKLTTANTELIMEETGDQFGTIRLHLQNRNGNAGPIFENLGLDLIDFIFKTSTGTQSNIRFEHRSGNVVYATPEFQIGAPLAPPNYPTMIISPTIVGPGKDGNTDLGNATVRWGKAFLSGQLKVKGKNVLVLENVDETQANATVPNADTALKTYSLPVNTYTRVIVEGEGYVTVGIGATQQDLNIKIRSAGVQKGNTVIFNPPIVTAAEKIPFSIKASFVQTGAATLDISIGAAAADLNTTVFLNSLRVYGET